MNPIELALVLGFLLVVAIVINAIRFLCKLGGGLQQNRADSSFGPAYEAHSSLLTDAERSFFCVLHNSLGSDYQIFAKVRLADIIRPVKNPSRSGWQRAFNRITGKHVDFVLCDPESLHVVAVIELDDRSHQSFDRGLRDGLVDSALADARIPVLRVPARKSYAPAQLREQVQSLFASPERTPLAPGGSSRKDRGDSCDTLIASQPTS